MQTCGTLKKVLSDLNLYLWLNLMAIYINLTVTLLDLEIESEGLQVDHSVKHLLSH